MIRPYFLEEIGKDGVARITFVRADVHNAFNDALIAQLTTVLRGLESDKRVRAVILAAKGKSFSAGADLKWMRSMASFVEAENLEDARALAELMRVLNGLSKPTLALVQGPAYGGGVGLVACCDIALAAEAASFTLSEVRLGLVPAVISPYIIAAIGARAARRYCITGERISAWEAHRLGLVHEVVAPSDLEATGRMVIDAVLAGGPVAQTAAKDLISEVTGRPIDGPLIEKTARRIAHIRVSPEGQEGLAAFFEKRPAGWVPK
jgi:methylglutaconyl-CoA hydratase